MARYGGEDERLRMGGIVILLGGGR